MASTIKLKRSATASKVPLTTDISLGELALNTYDGLLYFKKSPGGADAIVTTVTTDATQTLSNKTFVAPALGTPASGNFSSGTFTWPTFNQNTTGNAATATSATSATKLTVADTRNVTTTPQTIDQSVVFDFKANSSNALSDGGTYHGLMTFRQYGSSTDWTGGKSHQLGFTDNGNIWHRSGTSTTWGTWYKLYDSNNLTNLNQLTNGPGYITSYTETDTLATVTARGASTSTAVTFSGGITGTLTGNASSASTAASVTGLTLTSSANGINPDSVTQNQIGYNTSVSLFGQTDGGLYSSAYSSSWIHQIYGDFRTGQIAIRGKNSGTWQSWRTVLDSSNYLPYLLPRVSQSTSTTTLSWNSNNNELVELTALASNLSISADSGSPSNGQKILFRITSTGTYTLSLSTGTKGFTTTAVVIPSSLTATTYHMGCIYNSTTSKWEVVAFKGVVSSSGAEADTLATVTGRGATTSTVITATNGIKLNGAASGNIYLDAYSAPLLAIANDEGYYSAIFGNATAGAAYGLGVYVDNTGNTSLWSGYGSTSVRQLIQHNVSTGYIYFGNITSFTSGNIGIAGASDTGKTLNINGTLGVGDITSSGAISATNGITPRSAGISSGSSTTISQDWGTKDIWRFVGITATSLTIQSSGGTNTIEGFKVIIKFKPDVNVTSLTFSSPFRALTLVPTSLVAGKWAYFGCIYNVTDNVWDIIAVKQQA